MVGGIRLKLPVRSHREWLGVGLLDVRERGVEGHNKTEARGKKRRDSNLTCF